MRYKRKVEGITLVHLRINSRPYAERYYFITVLRALLFERVPVLLQT